METSRRSFLKGAVGTAAVAAAATLSIPTEAARRLRSGMSQQMSSLLASVALVLPPLFQPRRMAQMLLFLKRIPKIITSVIPACQAASSTARTKTVTRLP